MIEHLIVYREDFKGNRIPNYEQAFNDRQKSRSRSPLQQFNPIYDGELEPFTPGLSDKGYNLTVKKSQSINSNYGKASTPQIALKRIQFSKNKDGEASTNRPK
jgi:hypothetical protein